MLTGQHVFGPTAKLWIGGYDFGNRFKSFTLPLSADAVESTALGDDAHHYIPGLISSKFAGAGYFDPGAASVEGIVTPGSFLPITASAGGGVGDIAYFFNSVITKASFGGAVGTAFPFDVEAEVSSSIRVFRGFILEDGVSGHAAGTYNGSPVDISGVTADQNIYAVLHVLVPNGTSLDVTIESDAASSFLSPTTQLTFSTATLIGSEFVAVVPAPTITDTWWRFAATGVGTGNAQFVVAFAIF